MSADHGDRIKGAAAHREYYAQFVTPTVHALVVHYIGEPDILASVDEHMNDIQLIRWDELVPMLGNAVANSLKEMGDYLTLGTGVCILKEAAKQIKEGL